MDLKLLSVSMAADGFRLDAKNSGLTAGTALIIRYDCSGRWAAKEVEFEPEPPTLFHPFRKSMFIYTGERPRRVLVCLRDSVFSDDFDSDEQARRAFYDENNFFPYPDFDDVAWQSNDYGTFFASDTSDDAPPAPPEPVQAPEPKVQPDAPRDGDAERKADANPEAAPDAEAAIESAADLPNVEPESSEPNAY